MSTTFESDWENTRLKERINEFEREIAELKRDIEACPKGWHHSEVVKLEQQLHLLRDAALLLFKESGASLTYSLSDTVAQKAVREALAATEKL